MVELRPSVEGDIPQLKELWKLAFGDENAYIDHFFDRYYAPDRMLVLVDGGTVQAMTAWFDMPLVSADGRNWPAAYLYAVATHPDFRGKGLAGHLLAFADRWLKGRGFDCITTVPARPDLHKFFGQNGFNECFVLAQQEFTPQPGMGPAVLEPVSSQEYGQLREQALTDTAHVAYAPEALDYQAGVCALSGGGLYRAGKQGCACAEISDSEVFVKELLTTPKELGSVLNAIANKYPARRYWVRTPYTGQNKKWKFAMVKWLIPEPNWTQGKPAYLGLAFD